MHLAARCAPDPGLPVCPVPCLPCPAGPLLCHCMECRACCVRVGISSCRDSCSTGAPGSIMARIAEACSDKGPLDSCMWGERRLLRNCKTAARPAWPLDRLCKPWTSGIQAKLSRHLGDSVPEDPAPADTAARSTAAMSSVTKGESTGELPKDEPPPSA